MSKEQSHELQQQQPLQPSPDQPQQSQQQQFNQQQFNQQQTIPTEPQPTHNHLPGQETAADHGPPSYEQAKASPAGQPPAGIAPGQAVTTVTPLNQLTNTPEWIDCPFCHKRTKTTVRSEGGSMQMIVGGVLCLVCVCLACLPCALHWFEDTDWHCSQCKNKVAMCKNDGAIQVLGPTQVVYSQYGHEQQQMGNAQPQAPGQDGQQQPIPQHPGASHQQPGQNVQQSLPQHLDGSRQQHHEIQPQPLQTGTQPLGDVKN